MSRFPEASRDAVGLVLAFVHRDQVSADQILSMYRRNAAPLIGALVGLAIRWGAEVANLDGTNLEGMVESFALELAAQGGGHPEPPSE